MNFKYDLADTIEDIEELKRDLEILYQRRKDITDIHSGIITEQNSARMGLPFNKPTPLYKQEERKMVEGKLYNIEQVRYEFSLLDFQIKYFKEFARYKETFASSVGVLYPESMILEYMETHMPKVPKSTKQPEEIKARQVEVSRSKSEQFAVQWRKEHYIGSLTSWRDDLEHLTEFEWYDNRYRDNRHQREQTQADIDLSYGDFFVKFRDII